jgi:alpha-N-arabinofuranosidase
VPHARLALDREFTVGPVPRRLFGSFVEHMGRCVYTGVFEPGHPRADEQGLRRDVLDLTRRIGPTVVRYPGGNFVSGYRWEDGVGPVERRPRRRDRAWHSIESNRFGLGEFARWAGLAGTEPMLAVNLGTRGVQEACDLLEYANGPARSRGADLRAAHGHPEPYGIRLWCLGNEMDGPWQIGHTTAPRYGRLAARTARAMRRIDPAVELVACGSSKPEMATFGEWERQVLEEAYDEVDFLSAHSYYAQSGDDAPSFLASAVGVEAMIDGVVATADAVRARGRHRRRIAVAFDEWNVRTSGGRSTGRRRRRWEEAPRLAEDVYTVTDAVVVGTLLHALLRRCDRVTIGCQAQLVNVLGLLRSEPAGPAWAQTIALPFGEVRRLAVGASLQVALTGDRSATARYGDVPVVDAAATWDEESRALAVFAANRDPAEATTVDVALAGFGGLTVAGARVLGGGQDGAATNSLEFPDRVRLRPLAGVTPTDGGLRLELPPLSWSVTRLTGGATGR